MKCKYLTLLTLLPLVVGCANGVDVDLKDYVDTIYVNDISTFTICNLQDIHLSATSELDYEFAYYERVIYANGTTPNLITLNGDIFMDATKTVVNRFCKWIDSLDIPFAYTYGNHDLQGAYANSYIDTQIKKCKNSLLINPRSDKVYGDANYVINIEEGVAGASTLKWQVYILDSNNYEGFSYDVVHDDQIEWFRKQTKAVEATATPNLTFMHIPFEEFVEAWETLGGRQLGGHLDTNGDPFFMGEETCNGYRENNLYETMQQSRTKGVIVGHDHINNTDWHYNKDGNGEIRLIYGEKTGHNIYHDERIMGGLFITLTDGDTFTIARKGLNYENDTIIDIDANYITSLN